MKCVGRTAALAAACWLLAGAGGGGVAAAAGSASAPNSGPKESDLARSLIDLADSALKRGELDSATSKLERALTASPGSIGARVGLARIALRRGQPDAAVAQCEAALAIAPQAVEPRALLARILSQRGDTERAIAEYRAVLELEPRRYSAHHALAMLTGSAPRTPVPGPAQAVRVARAHPYDAWASLRAGKLLAAAGRPAAAIQWLEGAAWQGDADPQSALAAAEKLREIDATQADRRIVAVHLYADETVRADPAWKMRLRLLWLNLSGSLEPALATRFVPVSASAFDASRAPNELAAIDRVWRVSSRPRPREGLLAAFTQRRPSRRPGTHQLGIADYLGRHLIVRLERGAAESRTLAHEVMHTYGGVHVTPDITSLMNPEAGSSVLDALNLQIARITRTRRFGRGNLEAEVLSQVDAAALIRAFDDALRMNLAARRMGVARARVAAQTSRYVARDILDRTVALDAHLGDVSRLLAVILVRETQLRDAAAQLELAAKLYGRDTQRGTRASTEAKRLRRAARAAVRAGGAGG